ncbi:GxxExxY protein [Solitalea sp. MAHUQ-68]|uniref:GxxExxY protein n=1 Tax=Solitalea agri TaxID=2953739 RepID=A0A9X2FCF9_9SPHI|nr:GxxExxY protein [Solitalea agri]MCO4294343.1 GxxExxY protein [Solitalea agri]
MLNENELAAIAVNCCFKIHNELGPGLLESIYEEILYVELSKHNLDIQKQKGIPVYWDNKKLDMGFRADLILENKLIIEIKSVESLCPVHYKQLLTYLKLTNIKLGILVNFNESLIKDGLRRVVNNL